MEHILINPPDPNKPIDNGTPPAPKMVLDDVNIAVPIVNTPVNPPAPIVDPPAPIINDDIVIPANNPPVNVDVNNTDNNVTIEGVDYVLDVNGNATKDGAIVYTKDQLEDDTDNTDENDYISLVQQQVGLELHDETGTPIQFENTVDGFVAREKAIIDKVKKDTASHVYNTMINETPEISQLLNYKKLHGSLEGFSFNTDYIAPVYIENDAQNHKLLITKELQLKGLSSKDIEITIKGLEIDNSLGDRAKESESYLITKKNEHEVEQRNVIAEKQRTEQESLEKTYGVTIDNRGTIKPLNIEGSIYDIVVNKGKVGDFVIPATGIVVTRNGKKEVITREAIFNYIAITTPSGYSQLQIDEAKASKDNNYKVNKALKLLLGTTHTQNSPVKRVKMLRTGTNIPNQSKVVSSGDQIVFKFNT